MPKIDFLPDNKVFESEPGETVLDTAARNGIPVMSTHVGVRAMHNL